ncbi:hypothetical protein HK098_003308 [Nowakowskiella sp. JEL0407]|nr:hypothetical protein HK098_003308 [Nowakowskiella sp. JEL0407]
MEHPDLNAEIQSDTEFLLAVTAALRNSQGSSNPSQFQNLPLSSGLNSLYSGTTPSSFGGNNIPTVPTWTPALKPAIKNPTVDNSAQSESTTTISTQESDDSSSLSDSNNTLVSLKPSKISTTAMRDRIECFVCDRCYIKKVKCDLQKPRCTNCVLKDIPCTFTRKTDTSFGSHRSNNVKGKKDIVVSKRNAKTVRSKVKTTTNRSNSVETLSTNSSRRNSATTLQFTPTFESFTPQKIPIMNPNAFRPTPLQYQLPLSPAVIDELLLAFFPNIQWPLNVVHPRTFLANPYDRSQSLLLVICAIGSTYSELGMKLAKPGEMRGQSLFQSALGSLNYENPSLDDACSALLLSFYATMTGKGRTMYHLSVVLQTIGKSLKIWIDPDDPNSPPVFKSFNLIQKETLRRIYWCCSAIGLFVHTNPTTKRPLPDHVWLSLTEDAQNTPTFRPILNQIESSDVNFVANETGEMLNLVRSITRLCQTNGVNDLEVDYRAKMIRASLDAWEQRIFQVAPIFGHAPISKVQWMGVYLHITKYNVVLLAHRYLLVRYLEQVLKTISPETLSPENKITELLQYLNPHANLSIAGNPILESSTLNLERAISKRALEAEAFVACHAAANATLKILKDIILKYDPLLENAHPSLAICLTQLCIFLGVLSQHSETEVNGRRTWENYCFVKVVMKNLGGGRAKLAQELVLALEEVERKGWLVMKDFLMKFFSWDVSVDLNFEE